MKFLIPSIGLSLLLGLSTSAQQVVAPAVLKTQKSPKLEKLQNLEKQVREVVQIGLPATVALTDPHLKTSGTGVIVSADGLILTAAHVVGKSKAMTVLMSDGERIPARVLGANFTKDIAMVQLSKKAEGGWPFVEIGDSDQAKVGDWLVALGHAEGFNPGRTAPVRFGRVGGKRPGGFLLSDCTMIGGDSGGPLFDLNGKLIGIHSSIGENLGYNSHAGIAGFQADWKDLLAGKKWGQLSLDPTSNPDTPALGIGIKGIARGGGIVVGTVAPGLPAAKAGLREQDIIVGIEGERIATFENLITGLMRYQAGDRIKLNLIRAGKKIDKVITLTKREKLKPTSFKLSPLKTPVTHPIAFPRHGNPPQNRQARHKIDFIKPSDRDLLDKQSAELFQSLRGVVGKASQSTVEIWAEQIGSNPKWVGLGTVIGKDKVIAKLSEIQRNNVALRCRTFDGQTHLVTPLGAYPEHDLIVLKVPQLTAPTIVWKDTVSPALGSFLTAAMPDGSVAGMGVVSARPRSFLGIFTQAEAGENGVTVRQLQPQTAAEEAGLQVGDRILSIGKVKTDTHSRLVGALLGFEVGQKVPLSYLRNGKEKTTTVHLDERLPDWMPSSHRGAAMREMGTAISARSEGFPSAMQSDMQVSPQNAGAPVVNLQGEAVGLLIARTSRVKTAIIPARTLIKLLKKDPRPLTQQAAGRLSRRSLPRIQQAPQMPDRPQDRPQRDRDEVSDLFRTLRKLFNE